MPRPIRKRRPNPWLMSSDDEEDTDHPLMVIGNGKRQCKRHTNKSLPHPPPMTNVTPAQNDDTPPRSSGASNGSNESKCITRYSLL